MQNVLGTLPKFRRGVVCGFHFCFCVGWGVWRVKPLLLVYKRGIRHYRYYKRYFYIVSLRYVGTATLCLFFKEGSFKGDISRGRNVNV